VIPIAIARENSTASISRRCNMMFVIKTKVVRTAATCINSKENLRRPGHAHLTHHQAMWCTHMRGIALFNARAQC
jgi:hypothetical protein